MLAKKFKLLRKNLVYLLRKGKRTKMNWLEFRWVQSLPPSRFGLILSRKVLAKATARNLLKRKIFDIAAKYLPQSEKGLQILVRIFKAPNNQDLIDFEKILKDFFQ